MAGRNSPNVTIIKRKKVIAGGHHGGAWKVAYADFVTAMMAFFLLMWLLSVTSEETKHGLADYFNPTIPIHSTVGGGDGPFQGSSMFTMDVLSQEETGQTGDPKKKASDAEGKSKDDSLWDIQNELLGASGDAVEADPLLKHVRTRITDEGLIIEVFDIDGSPLFGEDSAEPNEITMRLVNMIGRVLSHTENPVAVTGHLSTQDLGEGRPDPWRLSSDRAQVARQLIVASGVTEDRIARVVGKSARDPSTDFPADSRNRRIEITLLRDFAP